jgi:hypothetical protein
MPEWLFVDATMTIVCIDKSIQASLVGMVGGRSFCGENDLRVSQAVGYSSFDVRNIFAKGRVT